jgi:lipopolysaccharide/colanic/teichoic acid biosynthesis glycosyltransferase
MAIRLIDRVIAAASLVPAAPVCLAAAAGIWLADGRPVLYAGRRVGVNGRVFTMWKLRTMRNGGCASSSNGSANGGAITGEDDARVFAFGSLLRRWKIDELPQLVNVLRGEMAIVGPRPEDPAIVDACYGPLAWETLTVPPGLASPGSIYNFTHGEQLFLRDASNTANAANAAATADAAYAHHLLPRKLALDLVYVRDASIRYDVRIILRAAACIVARGLGRRDFPDPPEMASARQLEPQLRTPLTHLRPTGTS